MHFAIRDCRLPGARIPRVIASDVTDPDKRAHDASRINIEHEMVNVQLRPYILELD